MPLDPGIPEQLLDTVRRFVANRLVPREEELAEGGRVPDDLVREMRELGLFGLSIPEACGGLGLTMEEEVRVAFELGQTSPAFRSLIGTNNGIGSQGIVLDGTEKQRPAGGGRPGADARRRRPRGLRGGAPRAVQAAGGRGARRPAGDADGQGAEGEAQSSHGGGVRA